MLRGSPAASSPHVMLNTAVDGSIISRSSVGTAATYITGAMQARPIWLKLTQAGTTVTASVSYDGQAWSVLGSTPAGGLASAGVVVTSGDPSVLNLSTFDAVAVDAAVGAAAARRTVKKEVRTKVTAAVQASLWPISPSQLPEPVRRREPRAACR
jgi:hypothetical protein